MNLKYSKYKVNIIVKLVRAKEKTCRGSKRSNLHKAGALVLVASTCPLWEARDHSHRAERNCVGQELYIQQEGHIKIWPGEHRLVGLTVSTMCLTGSTQDLQAEWK